MKKVTLVIVTPCTISIFLFFFFKRHLFKEFWVFYRVCQKKIESFWAKITDKGNKEIRKKSHHPLCSELKKAPGRNPSFFGMVYITVYENLQKCLIFEFPFELLFKYFNFFSHQKWCKMRLFEWFSNTVLSYISNATFLRPV